MFVLSLVPSTRTGAHLHSRLPDFTKWNVHYSGLLQMAEPQVYLLYYLILSLVVLTMLWNNLCITGVLLSPCNIYSWSIGEEPLPMLDVAPVIQLQFYRHSFSFLNLLGKKVLTCIVSCTTTSLKEDKSITQHGWCSCTQLSADLNYVQVDIATKSFKSLGHLPSLPLIEIMSPVITLIEEQ